ncbi:unnamed protein product [Triticum turgidum subsp. durum]|uniref:Uncharacterized protein n=1 Tax=Triticum turgidum subsp. durum TaxID=4567 RepID=A0A9R1PGB0_TRITD|nr:unnamed protein product [Triticum turgidum subsp. durum]
MSRRYLNLIVHDFNSRIYSLCRIDVRKHLFYEDSEMAQRAAHPAGEKLKNIRGVLAAMGGWKRLPPPAINFQASPSIVNKTSVHLFALLGGESNILYSDNNCQTTLCNIDLKIVDPFAPPNSCKSANAISLPITQAHLEPPSLYVLDLPSTPRTACSFEVLSLRENKPALPREWSWEILPLPPFFCNRKIAPDLYSYAVVNGSTICISSLNQTIGTYTFDTVSKEWSQAARWALPFFGKAEFVPELNLWFGLSACNPFSSLCAVDLSGVDSGQSAKLQHTWDYLDLPEDEPWLPSQLHLFNLGLGKFCVATFFGTELRTCDMSPYSTDSDYEDTYGREFAVFTGLEVKRRNDGEGPLQLIRHMSKRFSIGSRNIECVL